MVKKKRLSPRRRRLNNTLLNCLAVAVTLMPVVTIGTFTYQHFFSDPRRTVAMEPIRHSDDPRLFDEGLVSVTFDDGWESVYSNAMPVLAAHNIPTTQYILPGEFEEIQYISLAQAKSMRKAGHEVTSHSLTHPRLTDVSSEELDYQLVESKDRLIKEGLSATSMNFASPESAVNDTTMNAIRKYYGSHRNTYADLGNGIDGNDINIGPIAKKYDIIGFSVRTSTTDAQIQAALDYAKQNNGWLVLVYHQVDDSGTEYAVDTETFTRHMSMIKKSQLKTPTMEAVLRANPTRFSV